MNKKILVVDDTKENVEILLELLNDSYDVMVAMDGEMALEIAKEDMPCLILLDIMMPFLDGYDVCKRLKSHHATKEIPIIFITAKTDEQSIEKAYDMGGIDYITKPFKPKELMAKIKIQLQLQTLLRDLKESKNELLLLASEDPLTKLYNRRYLYNTAEYSLELAKRNKTDISIIILDIDNFKSVNDTYGHQFGDTVLMSLAKKLQELSRKSDIVARWGGEEFLILFSQTNMECALKKSEKIRKEVEKLVVNLEDGKELKFTISVGVSQIEIKSDTTIELAIGRADEALYEAKHNGKNKVCVKSREIL